MIGGSKRGLASSNRQPKFSSEQVRAIDTQVFEASPKAAAITILAERGFIRKWSSLKRSRSEASLSVGKREIFRFIFLNGASRRCFECPPNGQPRWMRLPVSLCAEDFLKISKYERCRFNA